MIGAQTRYVHERAGTMSGYPSIITIFNLMYFKLNYLECGKGAYLSPLYLCAYKYSVFWNTKTDSSAFFFIILFLFERKVLI